MLLNELMVCKQDEKNMMTHNIIPSNYYAEPINLRLTDFGASVVPSIILFGPDPKIIVYVCKCIPCFRCKNPVSTFFSSTFLFPSFFKLTIGG